MKDIMEQKTITINRRLRPIRLGFLVSPSDVQMLQRVIQINTCLWGGRFNPILPFFKKTHPSLVEGRYRPPARSIVAGYIEGFSPDYLVVKDRKAVSNLLPEKRIIELSEIVQPKNDQPFSFGLEAPYLYLDLYEKEFKFQRRHPIKVLLPYTKDKKLALFYKTLFGDFPSDEGLEYIERLYRDYFDAKEQEINPTEFFNTLFERSLLYPLQAGNISLKPQNPDRGRQIFFMDATSPLDLMDFWNLRATGRSVLPLPIQLVDHGIKEISAFVKRNHVPDKHNKSIMHNTTIICSRSCKSTDMGAFIKKLNIPDQSLIGQHWYPRLWDEWARTETYEGIGTVTAKEDSIAVVASGGRVTFSQLMPDFADQVSGERTPNWINVINFSESEKLTGAPVIPPGIANLDRILHDGSVHSKWATQEGIIVPCMNWGRSQFWELPTAQNLFQAYMEQFGFQMELSSAGKITLQVLRAIGGIWGIGSFSNEEVLKKLEGMARGIAESEDPASPAAPKVRAATVSHRTWWSLLQRINDNNPKIAENHLKNLLKSDVFRAGLRLQCPQCSQHTWFSLEQLNEKVECERCLQSFSFPMFPPSEDAWHYRTVGPFSIEGYAHGSYCTLLTANFLFGHHFHGETSWIPSTILKNPKQKITEIEIDFAAFWRVYDFGKRTSPVLVFGECKTFDQFKAKDVKRMATIADAFPGAVIVFSTLRKKLEDKEKHLIASLANKGRKHLKDERWRNPVMVLTGIELLHRMGPPSCWKEAGQPYENYETEYWQHRKPQELCDMLQRMHLGMDSYHVWYEKQRLAKSKKKGAAQ